MTVLLPEDINVARLQLLYDRAGFQTEVDADGDLIVTDRVTCYVSPTTAGDRLLLLAFVGIQDDAGEDAKLRYANQVNNRVSTVRARVNASGRVLFDFHLPIEGGVTEEAVVLATQFFMQATQFAATECDAEDIVR